MTTEKDDFGIPLKTNREYLSETYQMAKDTNETVKDLAERVYGNEKKEIKGLVKEVSELKQFKQQVKNVAMYLSGALGIGTLAAFGKKALVLLGEFFKVLSPIVLIYCDLLMLVVWIVARGLFH